MPNRRSSNATPDLVRSGLKFSHLRLLAALRDMGKIGAAAQHVGMTQPAASRMLHQLGEIVGTPLHTRLARGVVLTEAGRILADQAVATLRDLDRTRQQIGQIAGGMRGHVRVGSVTGPSLELVLPVLREMRLLFPEIEVSVHIDTSDRLAEALLANDIDLYMGRIPASADVRSFAIERIGPEPISLLVRIDHPLSGRRNVSIEDCLSFEWVMQPPGGLLRRTAESYLLERAMPLPTRVLGTTSILFTLAHVNETNAIAPLARAVTTFFIERGALGSRLATLPVAEDMAVSDYGIVARAEESLSPAAMKVSKLLSQHSRKSVMPTDPAASTK